MDKRINRRQALMTLGLGTGALGFQGMCAPFLGGNLLERSPVKQKKNNINHSVCRWTFPDVPLDRLAADCAEIGIKAIDLLRPFEWDTVKKHGLECSMATDDFANIENGFNDPANHAHLQEKYRELIDKSSAHGIRNVICFSGNRRGMDETTGIRNCAKGLLPLLEYASDRNVTLVMELLNSKIDHPDYMCDHTKWGVALADEMGRDNFKLLYDIYHMQVMEGDIIETIKKYHPYINHYHTAGVPGRNEIDDTQELYYPAIMRAIVETGFDGYVAQEFVPTAENKFSSLEKAVRICDV